MKIYRDAELEQLFADPAVPAEQGDRFLAIDPGERWKHEALLGLHVGQEVVIELGPQLAGIWCIGLERLK